MYPRCFDVTTLTFNSNFKDLTNCQYNKPPLHWTTNILKLYNQLLTPYLKTTQRDSTLHMVSNQSQGHHTHHYTKNKQPTDTSFNNFITRSAEVKATPHCKVTEIKVTAISQATSKPCHQAVWGSCHIWISVCLSVSLSLSLSLSLCVRVCVCVRERGCVCVLFVVYNKQEWMNVFLTAILHCNATLGWGQPERMRWILIWTMPLARGWSSAVILCYSYPL